MKPMNVLEIYSQARHVINFSGTERVCLLVTPDEWDALVAVNRGIAEGLYPAKEECVELYAYGLEIRKKYERLNFQPNDYIVMSGG